MSEHLNLALFLAVRAKVTGSRWLVSRVFEMSERWLGRPADVYRRDVPPGKEMFGSWAGAEDLLSDPVAEDELLTVYGRRPHASDGAPNSVSVATGRTAQTVTVSMSVDDLVGVSASDIEGWMLDLASCGMSLGPAVLVAGSEIEVEAAHTSVDQVIASALSPLSMVTWIVAADKWLPSKCDSFEAAGGKQSLVLLRHLDAKVRFDLRWS